MVHPFGADLNQCSIKLWSWISFTNSSVGVSFLLIAANFYVLKINIFLERKYEGSIRSIELKKT
tara:strand:+ start:328 stop:519 length:192 start_codon:yes stop_codon:yes gene_type:complete